MKYATLLLGLAIVLASVAVAAAKVDRKCVRDMRETFGEEQFHQFPLDGTTIRRQCDSANFVTNPNEYGWERSRETQPPCKLEQIKGRGAKQKRDAVCGGE